jgi:Family of unknown function (DUF6573)
MMHDSLWRDTEVIHTYTRAQALADGALIDISPLATEAGFRYPVAVTAAVWHILEPSDDLARLGRRRAVPGMCCRCCVPPSVTVGTRTGSTLSRSSCLTQRIPLRNRFSSGRCAALGTTKHR